MNEQTQNIDYGKTFVGDSGQVTPTPEPGFSVWIEHGKWYIAPTVDGTKFGGHAYENGGYERGINNCPCGCYMGSASSSGPVNPFGPCPLNPREESPKDQMRMRFVLSPELSDGQHECVVGSADEVSDAVYRWCDEATEGTSITVRAKLMSDSDVEKLGYL